MSRTTIRAALIERLKKNALIQATEPLHQSLETLMDQALVEHDPRLDDGSTPPDYTNLPTKEYYLVTLLAWAQVCIVRASFASPQPNLPRSSAAGGYGVDRSSVVSECTKLEKVLRQRYAELKTKLDTVSGDSEADLAGDITLGELYRFDDLAHRRVPNTTSPNQAVPVLEFVSLNSEGDVVGTDVDNVGMYFTILKWRKEVSRIFAEYVLFSNTESAIFEHWSHSGLEGIPHISSNSQILWRSSQQNLTSIRVSTLELVQTTRFLLGARDVNNRWVFSKEIALPAQPIS